MRKLITITFALVIGLNGFGQTISNKEVKKKRQWRRIPELKQSPDERD